jgi:hypothetical protein
MVNQAEGSQESPVRIAVLHIPHSSRQNGLHIDAEADKCRTTFSVSELERSVANCIRPFPYAPNGYGNQPFRPKENF